MSRCARAETLLISQLGLQRRRAGGSFISTHEV